VIPVHLARKIAAFTQAKSLKDASFVIAQLYKMVSASTANGSSIIRLRERGVPGLGRFELDDRRATAGFRRAALRA
jgi:hypothetical protein